MEVAVLLFVFSIYCFGFAVCYLCKVGYSGCLCGISCLLMV